VNIYIEQPSQGYWDMFKRVGHLIVGDALSADLICFTGGEDVTPSFYGEKKHFLTGNFQPRDEAEKRLFEEAVEFDVPMVGICRGGQFLNVMNGGKMYQHVTNHCREHVMTTSNGREILVTSTHHQMMREGPSGVVLAYANEDGDKEYMPSLKDMATAPIFEKENYVYDREVIFYPHTRCLCFQPHPEFFSLQYQDMTDYFFSLSNHTRE